MRPQLVMFVAFVFAVGTIISLTFGWGWVGAEELAMTNSLTVFKDANILGVWSMTIPNIDFFFTGMKSLMMMDFAFFTGGLELLQLFFILVIGSGVLWGLYSVVIGVLTSALGRR